MSGAYNVLIKHQVCTVKTVLLSRNHKETTGKQKKLVDYEIKYPFT